MPNWIAVAVNVLDDPEIVAVATDLGISAPEMVGHLVALWGCMAQHARRGDITGVTDGGIESWARWNGAPNLFATRFRAVFAPKGKVKNWDRYNGKLLRQAELSAKRKRQWREQKERERNASATRGGTETEPGRHADDSGNQTRPNQTRPNQKNKVSMPRLDDPRFDAFWAAYPRRSGDNRGRAEQAWQARIREGVSPETLIAAAAAYAAHVKRERKEPQFVKLAATFLGPSRAWEDDYGPVAVELPDMYLPNGEFNPAAAAALGVPMPR